jgi:hypothetical protein
MFKPAGFFTEGNYVETNPVAGGTRIVDLGVT